jgi:hypothetical protein
VLLLLLLHCVSVQDAAVVAAGSVLGLPRSSSQPAAAADDLALRIALFLL